MMSQYAYCKYCLNKLKPNSFGSYNMRLFKKELLCLLHIFLNEYEAKIFVFCNLLLKNHNKMNMRVEDVIG